jgi:hypothetical protein
VEARDASEPLFEISALLFSIKDRRPVVLISMSHRGAELTEALEKFSKKLREAVPAVSCTGWDLQAPIDVSRIQALAKRQVPEAAIGIEPASE